MEETFAAVAKDVRLGPNVKLGRFINLYGCTIGENTKIGAFVEIQKNAEIGRNCKISSHSFVCEGVVIRDNVFVGHNVTFINDLYPRATTAAGQLQDEKDWEVTKTIIEESASIGSSSTILCGITVGEHSIIGAGSVVTKDVPPYSVVAGNPARVLRSVAKENEDESTVSQPQGTV